MVERYKVEEFLYQSCEKVKRNGQGYVMRCPVCGDSKKNPNKRRCHVDYFTKYDEWVYKCYNGGCHENSGNIQSLYAYVMGVSWKEANDALSDKKYDGEKLKERLDGGRQYDDEIDKKNTALDLDLNDCISLTDVLESRTDLRYLELLKRFHIERWVPTRRGIMIAKAGKYKNRFIIPVYEGGHMIYFQGRTISKDVEPKYLNPDVVKESIVLNRENFDPDKYIVVSEGLIDGFMVEDDQGTTCLGASVSDEFLEKIVPLSRKGVIIALDNPDLDESGYKNYIKIIEQSRYARQLKYFFMPNHDHKDLNDLRLSNKSMNIYDFVIQNSMAHFKASIKMRNVI